MIYVLAGFLIPAVVYYYYFMENITYLQLKHPEALFYQFQQACLCLPSRANSLTVPAHTDDSAHSCEADT
jgi:hypothetical protein